MPSARAYGLSVAAVIHAVYAARSPTLTFDLAAEALHPLASQDHLLANAQGDVPQWMKVRPKVAKFDEQPESLLMKGFRFILSGMGSSAEANLALKRAKNELLQEHVQALHDHGYYGCAAPGHALSNRSISSSLLEVKTRSKVQTHLSAMSQSQMEAFAKTVFAEFHGHPLDDEHMLGRYFVDKDHREEATTTEPPADDDAGDNQPRQQDLPENVKPGFKKKLDGARRWFVDKTVNFRGQHGNALANIFMVFKDSCMVKLLFAFYKHEGEDDYPYFPRGCVDSWGEVMTTGDAFRAAQCLSRTVLLLVGALLSLRATSARD